MLFVEMKTFDVYLRDINIAEVEIKFSKCILKYNFYCNLIYEVILFKLFQKVIILIC